MKIGLVQTYRCHFCERYAYPHDIDSEYPEDTDNIDELEEIEIWVLYRCACGHRHVWVPHVIDENNELFPHYAISRRAT